jgi:hypothetical protein
MVDMGEIADGEALPVWIKELLSLGLTISAALLYAAVLGLALWRTFHETAPEFSATMVRTASVLSGLVGTVVAAGFSRSKRQVSVHVTAQAPNDPGRDVTWTTVRRVPLIKRNLLGLAGVLGLPVLPLESRLLPMDEDSQPPLEVTEPAANKWATRIAVLYFVVYFAVGVCAFGLSLLRREVPEIIANAGWVWLGTLATAGYSFFAVDSR